jgi:hypothetical protein
MNDYCISAKKGVTIVYKKSKLNTDVEAERQKEGEKTSRGNKDIYLLWS